MDRSIADRAHRALPDAYVTAHLLREILKHASIGELISWTKEPILLPRVPFGKHRGQAWKDVPPDYLQWILRQQDMNEDVVHTARHHLEKRQ
jgi:exodeoxyribonuclease X